MEKYIKKVPGHKFTSSTFCSKPLRGPVAEPAQAAGSRPRQPGSRELVFIRFLIENEKLSRGRPRQPGIDFHKVFLIGNQL